MYLELDAQGQPINVREEATEIAWKEGACLLVREVRRNKAKKVREEWGEVWADLWKGGGHRNEVLACWSGRCGATWPEMCGEVCGGPEGKGGPDARKVGGVRREVFACWSVTMGASA